MKTLACPMCFAPVPLKEWTKHWRQHRDGGLVDLKFWDRMKNIHKPEKP